MIGQLPETLFVSSREYEIRTDYRNILQACSAFQDPELDEYSKCVVAVYLLFIDFQSYDEVYSSIKEGFDLVEAIEQIGWFVSLGKSDSKEELPTYDWEQDEQMIFSAINKVARCEVRELDYMHWWTFCGYFNEVDDGSLRFIMGIRYKINHCQKLEKHEIEFYKNNRELIVIKKKLSEEEKKAQEEKKAIMDKVFG